jgi:hypothetical protein
MTAYIHVSKKNRMNKGNFVRYKVSHMDIDCKDQKDPNMTKTIPLFQFITLQIIRKI